jgi:hypothetical protein
MGFTGHPNRKKSPNEDKQLASPSGGETRKKELGNMSGK